MDGLNTQVECDVAAVAATVAQHQWLCKERFETLKREEELAATEREKAAAALRDGLARHIDAGDANLRQHIEHQREQVKASFEASEKAIYKAEAATEKRFEALSELREQLRQQAENAVPREVFDQTLTELRRRQDAMLEFAQTNSNRITQIEARGGGEKDQAAEFKSIIAVGVAVVSVLVSTGLGLANLLGT